MNSSSGRIFDSLMATEKAKSAINNTMNALQPCTYLVHTVAWHVSHNKAAHFVRLATFLSIPMDVVIKAIATPFVYATCPIIDVALPQPLALRIVKGTALGLTVPLLFTIGLIVSAVSLIFLPLIVMIPVWALKQMSAGNKGTEKYLKEMSSCFRGVDVLNWFQDPAIPETAVTEPAVPETAVPETAVPETAVVETPGKESL